MDTEAMDGAGCVGGTNVGTPRSPPLKPVRLSSSVRLSSWTALMSNSRQDSPLRAELWWGRALQGRTVARQQPKLIPLARAPITTCEPSRNVHHRLQMRVRCPARQKVSSRRACRCWSPHCGARC